MYVVEKTKVKVAKQVLGLIKKPTPVVYIGSGKVNEMGEILKYNNSKKVLIITDKVLKSLGLLDNMISAIEKEGIKAIVFDEVTPDPTFSIVEKALSICKRNECDSIIAFGGGSVIDASKVVSVCATNEKTPKEMEGTLKVKNSSLPFIAVPTTAGTGSETTIVAVISDDATHKKTTIIDPKIVPTVAVLDPELTTGLPPHITSTTTMDALTHALEAYVGEYATEETDKQAINAIKLIFENLPIAMENPKDLKARENLLLGSFYAGMSFTRALVGYVHAFSHNIGGKFGVPHGLGNAVLLPHVLESYLVNDTVVDKIFKLCEILDMVDSKATKKANVKAFVNKIREFNTQFGIPERLEKFPAHAIDTIIDASFKECHGGYPVPVYYTKEEARELLSKVCDK